MTRLIFVAWALAVPSLLQAQTRPFTLELLELRRETLDAQLNVALAATELRPAAGTF